MTTVSVLPGRERRRRWTAAEKLVLVEESLAPEANVTDVARRYDVHPNLLHLWRKQARTGVLRAEHAAGTGNGGMVSFAAVTVAAEAAPASPSPVPAPGTIEIEFACGARLRISGGVEPATAAAVVAAMSGRRR